MIEVFRREIKYVIGLIDFYRLKPVLEKCLEKDSYAKEEGYGVRSLYFDSAYDDDMRDVLDGVLSKQKVRLRVYSPDDEKAKLEFKCKTGAQSIKKTIIISRNEALLMVNGEYGFLSGRQEETAKELFARMKMGVYQPRVVVDYKRIPFKSELNNIRITFDHSLMASFDKNALFDKNAYFETVMPKSTGVLEVKYNGFLPQYLKEILRDINSLSTANSKYVLSRMVL